MLFSLCPSLFAGAYEDLNYTFVTPPYSETAELTDEDGLSERGTYAKGYSFYAQAGMAVSITLISYDFDAYLYLLDADRNVLTEDDDSGGGRNSHIYYVLPYSGLYYVQATQFSSDTGSFEISISVSVELIDGATVSDWGGLKTWLNMFEYDGGTVYLGADIEINGVSIIGSSSGMGEPIVIETGPYGLIVNDSLRINGNVSISGNGSPKPVVHIGSGGWLFINSMDAYEKAVSIAATGAGGTALKLESGARYGSDDDGVNYTAGYFAHYKTSGPDSIAIDSAIRLNLENHYIDAGGSGSRGIVSTEPVSMYLSVVTANGAAVSTPGVVTLDTCLVSPGVAGATIVNRKATGVTSLFGQVQSVSAGKETTGYFSEGLYRIYLSADGLPDRVINSRVYLDDSAVDYDKPGRYYIPLLSLNSAPYDAFDLVSATSPAYLTVDIIDPYIPYLNQMRYVSSFWGSSYYLIEHLYSGDEELTLWYTEDDGESWSVLWKSGDEAGDAFEVEIYPDDITIYIYDETGFPSPALFAYEVGTGKGSEVFYIDLEELRELGEYGGDRTGGDRYQKPWDVIIGGGNDGGENGNSPRESGGGGDILTSTQPPDGSVADTEASKGHDAERETTVTEPGGSDPDSDLQIPVVGGSDNAPQQSAQTGNLILEPSSPLTAGGGDADSGGGNAESGGVPPDEDTAGSGTEGGSDGGGTVDIDDNDPVPVVGAPAPSAPQVVPQIPLPDILTEQLDPAYTFPVLLLVVSIIGACGVGVWLVYFFRHRKALKV